MLGIESPMLASTIDPQIIDHALPQFLLHPRSQTIGQLLVLQVQFLIDSNVGYFELIVFVT